jgi:hypothetical protein
MDPRVREMYKKLLFIGRHYYPFDNFPSIKSQYKAAILKNANLSDEIELKKAIAKGRYYLRELTAISQLHKYRTMKKRYNSPLENDLTMTAEEKARYDKLIQERLSKS